MPFLNFILKFWLHKIAKCKEYKACKVQRVASRECKECKVQRVALQECKAEEGNANALKCVKLHDLS
jgi:hypothetical protein